MNSNAALLKSSITKTINQEEAKKEYINFSSSEGHLAHRWCLYDPRWQAVRVSLLGGWNWRDEQSINAQLAILDSWLERAPKTYFGDKWPYGIHTARITAETQIFNLIDAVFYSWGSETGKYSKAIHNSVAYRRIVDWRQETRNKIADSHAYFNRIRPENSNVDYMQVVLLTADEQRILFADLSAETQLLISRDLRKRWRHAIRKAKAAAGGDVTQLFAESRVQSTRKELYAFCVNTGIKL